MQQRHALIPILAFIAFFASGCQAGVAGTAEPASAHSVAYDVNGNPVIVQGATSVGARSALEGSTEPGKQEILGAYLPIIGTGLAIKAGLEYDGTPRRVTIPIGRQRVIYQQQAVGTYATDTCLAPQAATCAPQTHTVMVEECETVMVEQTTMVPQKTMVPQTRKKLVPRTYVLTPQVAPAPRAVDPCNPGGSPPVGQVGGPPCQNCTGDKCGVPNPLDPPAGALGEPIHVLVAALGG